MSLLPFNSFFSLFNYDGRSTGQAEKEVRGTGENGGTEENEGTGDDEGTEENEGT